MQVNELELFRGGKRTGTSFVVTIRCKVFVIFGPMTGMTASLLEIRRPRIKPSSTETLLQMSWKPLLLPRPLQTAVLRA